jgi:anaerobic magnesium-protoporphyrin IX monomethyl ester cyclase
VPRLTWRRGAEIIENADGPLLDDLDRIPSPFAADLVDLSRGFVYYESSRGCPYRCSFCMSARDNNVRSFSLQRIKADLGLLLEQQVPRIKFVDRTFNYDPVRTRELFSFILQNNRSSHLHFEIGAHLLDDATITLLETVPPDTFQFEIGVQSTLPETLRQIDRHVALDRLLSNISKLRQRTRIHLHLDLIAGLPGESGEDVLASIDTLMALRPHHLQIEPVKVLPGAPLRDDAATLGLRFDPHPPYTIVGNNQVSFAELERLRGVGRLLDLTWNSDRLQGFLTRLAVAQGHWSTALSGLADHLQKQGAFRHPLSQTGLFQAIEPYIGGLPEDRQGLLREALAYDYALCERVLPGSASDWFDTEFSRTESDAVEAAVSDKRELLAGQGVKIQHFAAAFSHLEPGTRQVLVFFYLTRSGQARQTEVEILTC